MTTDNLLSLIGTAKSKYLLEAQALMEGKNVSRKKMPKVWLIAAIIGTLLLLAGCVAYVLHLQDLSVGQTTEILRYDEDGNPIDPTEMILDIVTLQGHNGEPVQLAMKEWHEFQKSYDPDGKLGDTSGLPQSYVYTYGCYTQKMVDKLDEITEKHGLKLLDTFLPIQRWQWDAYLENVNFDSLLLPGTSAVTKNVSGIVYPPSNLRLEFEYRQTPEDQGWLCYYLSSQKDTMPGTPPWYLKMDAFEQWNYQAKDGTNLLLALSERGSGLIVADTGSTMTAISMDSDENLLTRDALEAAADTFDYHIDTEIPDVHALENSLEQAEAVWQEKQASYHKTYAGFDEFMKGNPGIVNDPYDYLLMDITGDGQQELLVGMDGRLEYWFELVNGKVEPTMILSAYLCQGNVLESSSGPDDHAYFAPYSDDAIIGPEGLGEPIVSITKYDGHWCKNPELDFGQTKITEEEAMEIVAQYPRVPLDWQSAKDYPLENGRTLLEFVEETYGNITNEDRIDVYQNLMRKRWDQGKYYETHYRLMDINGDGIIDFLRSTGEEYGSAIYYQNGSFVTLFSREFLLCEEDVLYSHISEDYYDGTGLETHTFLRLEGRNRDILDFLAYDPDENIWYSDAGQTPITAEEAQAILIKYHTVDQQMRPMDELMDE